MATTHLAKRSEGPADSCGRRRGEGGLAKSGDFDSREYVGGANRLASVLNVRVTNVVEHRS